MGIGDSTPQQDYCIYMHASRFSDKVYVGITNNVKRRWARKEESYKRSPHIYNALKKYGWDNFVHVVLHDKLTKEQACEEEKAWIALFKLSNRTYNITDGGEGVCGTHRTEEEKEHLRKTLTGRKASDELKAKLRKVQQEKSGKKIYSFDPNTKELVKQYPSINDAARQLNTTYHTIARAAKGKRVLAKELLWSFTPYLDAALQQSEIKYKRGKVYCYDLEGNFIKEYSNSREAAEAVNGYISAIIAICNKKHLSYKGFIWRKEKEEIDEDILLRIKKSRQL